MGARVPRFFPSLILVSRYSETLLKGVLPEWSRTSTHPRQQAANFDVTFINYGCARLSALEPPKTPNYFETPKPDILRMGHWKRGICIKLSEIDFPSRDKFTTILRTLTLMYKTKYPAILRKFGAQFATNLRNAPRRERPLLGISDKSDSKVTLGRRL